MNITLNDQRVALINIARAQNAPYPQYKHHFDSYILVRVKKKVRTKMGVAFIKDEFAIASNETHSPGFVTVYSSRNKIDTSINITDVIFI